MLYWLQTSLNAAARQVAIKAATNSRYAADAVAQRCSEAVDEVGQVFPGYSFRVRQDYVSAVKGGKTGVNPAYAEIDQAGGLRTELSNLGARRPTKFWGGSPRTGASSNANQQYGGCYALVNDRTRQVVYHTVIHCSGCWPVFLKFLYPSSGKTSALTLSAWLEGRGSYSASQGTQDALKLNKSLLSSGVRPFLCCGESGCDQENGGNQDSLLGGCPTWDSTSGSGGEVCKKFEQPTESRPAVNQIIGGQKRQIYSVDQWAQSRGRLCSRCHECNTNHSPTKTSEKYCYGDDPKPVGILDLKNCGDIDPLIWVGIRYACMGTDAFGRVMNSSSDPKSSDYIGACDQYISLKPVCNNKVVKMDKNAGDVTNLDGNGKPCIIRRDPPTPPGTKLICRVDSMEVKPWYGPYESGPDSAEDEVTKCANGSTSGSGSSSTNNPLRLEGVPKDLCNPLDQAIPYHAVCDICNPGSPMCGMYGTCRNQSNLWEAKMVFRSQWWTNTSFYNLNPIYYQIECKMRRDCQERHCCADAENLDGYCMSRQIQGGPMRYGRSCQAGQNMWFYKGVPNKDSESHSPYHLPRLGGFPHCSNTAVRTLKSGVGECCAADVQQAILPCGPEQAPLVVLTDPVCSKKACGLRNCTASSGKKKRFCPAELPSLNGECLASGQNYPIGGESICGPGAGPGSMGTVAPADSPTLPNMCQPTIPPANCQAPPIANNSKSQTSGNTTESCNTQTKCMCTPVILSLSGKEPSLSAKRSCFQLHQGYPGMSYSWIKGEPGIAFLADDVNRNGVIDDGSELFGTTSQNRYHPNGYTAMGFLKDKNGDGLLTDRELDTILLWEDRNEDSISQKDEIKRAIDLGITEIDAGRYQAKKLRKINFAKDGSVYSVVYSPTGFKQKTAKGLNTGKTWDLVFTGTKSKACSGTPESNLEKYLKNKSVFSETLKEKQK